MRIVTYVSALYLLKRSGRASFFVSILTDWSIEMLATMGQPNIWH